MAKKQVTIERVAKSVEWAKNVIGLTEKELKQYVKEGFPVLYIYDVFKRGQDGISIRCFKTVLPDRIVNEKFQDSANASVCEVDLRGLV